MLIMLNNHVRKKIIRFFTHIHNCNWPTYIGREETPGAARPEPPPPTPNDGVYDHGFLEPGSPPAAA